MTYTLTRLCLALAFSMALLPVHGQTSRTIIINGGLFEFAQPFTDQVSVAYWDFANRRQVLVDTIPAQSVTDAVTYGDTLFVATDRVIRSYRLPDFQELATSLTISGIRKVIKTGNALFASRGFGTPSGGSYLLRLNATTLSVIDSVPYYRGDLEHLTVVGNTLYASAPGNFLSDTGNILAINVSNNQLILTYELGTLGEGIGRTFIQNNELIGLSSRGFGAPLGGITRINLNGSITSVSSPLPYSVGYSAVYYTSGRAFGSLGTSGLGVAADNLQSLLATPRFNRAIASAAYDPLLDQYYVATADYTSPAKAFSISGSTGAVLDSITVGIAPEAMVVWQSAGPISVKGTLSNKISVYPNPAANSLNFSEELEPSTSFKICDLTGRFHHALVKGKEIDITTLPAGIYTICIKGTGSQHTIRFIKS
jgi:hypothetical protein